MTDTQTAFVLVPREPTEEMLEASVSPRYEFLTDAHVSVLKDGFAAKYRAMLSAAPKPPESEIGPVAWRGEVQDGARKFTAIQRVAEIWSEQCLTVHPLYPQARIDADAATIAALRAEVERLRHDAGELVVAQYATSAAEARVKELGEALTRQKLNIEHWLETGTPASPEESKSIYEQICAALASKKETVDGQNVSQS